MKKHLLYTLLLAGVLLVAGCSRDRPSESGEISREQAESNLDTTHGEGSVQESSSIDGQNTLRVLFFGDSITAGYGLNKNQAFPALIQEMSDAAKFPVTIVDGGFSGETSSGGLRRIDWLMQEPIEVLVLELGGNDGLRGVPLSLTEDNLRGIIRKTLERYPYCKIIVAGMQVPPNIGHEYTKTFREIYPRIATEFDAELIPFILEGVGGIDEMMQPDGIHPNAEGHRRVAEIVWATLEPVLEDALDARDN